MTRGCGKGLKFRFAGIASELAWTAFGVEFGPMSFHVHGYGRAYEAVRWVQGKCLGGIKGGRWWVAGVSAEVRRN